MPIPTPSDHPKLSVVVGIVSDTMKPVADTKLLANCLDALAQQASAPDFEVVVPCLDNTIGIDETKAKHPNVVFVPVTDESLKARSSGSREHHDVLRATGLLAARGELIGLLEDHARPDGNWCANVVAAHDGNYAGIGGAIENDVDRPLNWAVYFCDFGKYQNPVPAGESAIASDANVTYKKTALHSIRSKWEHSFREPVVNGTLLSNGEKLALRPDIIVYQHRSDLQMGTAFRERFSWGRSYAATRRDLLPPFKRLVYAVLSPLLPFMLTLRHGSTAWQRRKYFGKFVMSAPLIFLLLAGWSIGEGLGYLVAPSDRVPDRSE